MSSGFQSYSGDLRKVSPEWTGPMRMAENLTVELPLTWGQANKGNRVSQAEFLGQSCGLETNADLVGATNLLAKFLSRDTGVAPLASGYCASVHSLWSGGEVATAMKQEPNEGVAA